MSTKYTEEEFKLAVKLSFSKAEVCRRLGISDKGGNINTVTKNIKKLNLDCSHFTGMRWNKGKTHLNNNSIKAKSLDDILVKNSKYQSHKLKLRLL